jgi:hypothetical protein
LAKLSSDGGHLGAEESRLVNVEGQPFTVAQGEEEALAGERTFLQIGQTHAQYHLSQVDESARGEVQRSAVSERAFAPRSTQDRMRTQGMDPLLGGEVGSNDVVGLDGGNGADAEAVAGGSGRFLIIGRSGSRYGRISQCGTFLRGLLGRVGRSIPVPLREMHERTLGRARRREHPEIYGRAY